MNPSAALEESASILVLACSTNHAECRPPHPVRLFAVLTYWHVYVIVCVRACSKKTFGAFHEGTWAGNEAYDDNAKANFLFKLGDSLEKFPNKGSGSYAYKGSKNWPNFGNGDDLDWGNSGKLGNGAECKASSYSGHATNEICGGTNNWGTTHLEVWRLA